MIYPFIIDPWILLPVVGLGGISLFLFASTAPQLLLTQSIFFLIGIVIYFIISRIDYRLWLRLNFFIYIFSILILVVSLMAPEVRGTHRWIYLFNTGLQPSELLKPFMIIFLANLFVNTSKNNLVAFLKPVILFCPIIILIFKQPDLGNVLVYLSIIFGLEIMAGLAWRYIIIFLSFIFLLMPILWKLLKNYQKQRIISFINPQTDPVGTGYNALQAMIAVGSGQLFGFGLGKGSQSQLRFLPEYHTDFIFASISESLGFLGGTLVIFFYLILLIKILKIAYSCDDVFGKLISIGIFTQLFIQIFINIGMNLGIMPITGITLPLVSYGGSSIVSTFISLAILKSISEKNKINPLVLR